MGGRQGARGRVSPDFSVWSKLASGSQGSFMARECVFFSQLRVPSLLMQLG